PLPEMLQPTADPVDLSASSAIRASSRPGSRSAFNQSASQASLQQDYIPTRIIQVKPTREVRSNEFHYFDHPAIGIFIQLTPYEVPPPPEPVLPAAGQFPAPTPPPLELQ